MRKVIGSALTMMAAARAGVSVATSAAARGAAAARVGATMAGRPSPRRAPFSSHPGNALVARGIGRCHSTRALCLGGESIMAAFASPPLLGRRIGGLSNHQHPPIQQQHPQQRRSPSVVPRRNRSSSQVNDADVGEFYANPESFPDFASLGITSPTLLNRLESPPNGLRRPSAVQAATFEAISRDRDDVIVGAETGSGKTLAYLLPLVDDILRRKREWKANNDGTTGDGIMDPGYDYARAVVLVPNKELAHQAVRMAASVCGGLERCVIWGAEALGIDQVPGGDVPEEDIVRLAVLPGGLSAPQDFAPFRHATTTSSSGGRQPPPDLVFATPANLGPMALSPKHIDLFADVSTVVVDEADMLLDGGYIQQLNNVLMGFRRADRLLDNFRSTSFRRKGKRKGAVVRDDVVNKKEEDGDDENGAAVKDVVVENEEVVDDENDWFDGDGAEGGRTKMKTQHVFVAATLPDYGLRSVNAYLNKKFPNATNITMAGMHNARHYGLESECRTIWNEIEDNMDRMRRLVDVLKLDRSEVGEDGRGLKGEKVMVFLNTVRDVDGATNGLRRAGINAVPYHSKLTLEERTANLDKFRRYRAPAEGDDYAANAKNTVPVLVCTDVASRGLDVPGVTAVVQLQFAQNVVAHLHRMGRCGRAGNRDGRGIIFHGAKQRELIEVVREAEEQQSRMTLMQDVDDEELEDADSEKGKVERAFSRKRGFTKKRKKQRKRAREAVEGMSSEYDN